MLLVLIKYVTHTKDRGLILAPKDLWSTGYSFKIHGGQTPIMEQILIILGVYWVVECLLIACQYVLEVSLRSL